MAVEELELEQEAPQKPIAECSYQDLVGDVVDAIRAEKSAKALRDRAEVRLTAKLKKDDRSGVQVFGYEALIEQPEKPAWDTYKLQGILDIEEPEAILNALLEKLGRAQLRALVKSFPDMEEIIEKAYNPGVGKERIVITQTKAAPTADAIRDLDRGLKEDGVSATFSAGGRAVTLGDKTKAEH